jgi:phosphate transport system substrate-binding protein
MFYKSLIAFVSVFLFPSILFSDQRIHIVGSSTVFPFTSVVAERFGKSNKYKTPVVESTGTGGGFKLFCSNKSIDINDASRKIKPTELKICKSNGITPVELKVGFDGVVMVQSNKAKDIKLTLKELFLALAKQVVVGNKLVKNPYKKWSDINKKLPNKNIEVLGPPETSGTRDAFVEIALEQGAMEIQWMRDLKKKDKNKFKNVAHTLRTDGAYIKVGENDNLIVQKLKSDADRIGIFGYSFLEENTDSVKAIKINDVEATFENISSKKYPISRSLFIYFKKQSIDKYGLKEFLKLYISNNMISEDGYLVDKGLIPMNESDIAKIANKIK